MSGAQAQRDDDRELTLSWRIPKRRDEWEDSFDEDEKEKHDLGGETWAVGREIAIAKVSSELKN